MTWSLLLGFTQWCSWCRRKAWERVYCSWLGNDSSALFFFHYSFPSIWRLNLLLFSAWTTEAWWEEKRWWNSLADFRPVGHISGRRGWHVAWSRVHRGSACCTGHKGSSRHEADWPQKLWTFFWPLCILVQLSSVVHTVLISSPLQARWRVPLQL